MNVSIKKMSNSGIEYRTAKIAFATGLSTVVSIALQLVSVPICLKYWGNETYGIWLALLSAFMLLRALETGYTNYIGNKINISYHISGLSLRKTLASSITGFFIIGIIQMSICVVLFASDGVPKLLGVPAAESAHHHAGAAFLIISISWVLTGAYLGVVHRLMIPAGMMYQASWWALAFQACQTLLMIVAALNNFSIMQTSIFFVIVQALIYFGSALYIRYKLPEFYPWYRGNKPVEGIKDLGKSVILTISAFFQQGSSNGIILVVSMLGGAVAVPIFTTVRTLANLWTNVTNIFTSPLLPDIVRYHVSRDGDKLIAVLNAHWVLIGTLVNLGILGSYPIIKPLYEIWTNHSVALDKALLCLLLSSIAMANAGALMFTYLAGINCTRFVLVSSVLRGSISIIGGFALIPRFGLAGLGAAIFLGEAIVFATSYRYFFRTELEKLQINASAPALSSLALGMVSTLAFFALEASNSPLAFWIYPLSVAGIMFAGWHGWIKLDQEVKNRISGIIISRFKPRSAARSGFLEK